MNLDERMLALRGNIESIHAKVTQLIEAANRDGEFIRSVARIAIEQSERLSKLKGGVH